MNGLIDFGIKVYENLRDLVLWITNSNRKISEFPRPIFWVLVVVVFWELWGWLGSPGAAIKVMLAAAVAATLFLGVLKLIDRRAELLEEGVEEGEGYWKLVKNFFRAPATFKSADEKWQTYVEGQGVKYGGKTPTLVKHKLTASGEMKAFVDMGKIGAPLDRIATDAVTVLPGIMRCKEVSVSPVSGGAGWVTFWKKSPLEEPRSILDLPPAGVGSKSFGWQNDNNAATIKNGWNFLVGAASGAGKSKLTWNLWFDLVRDETPTEVWICDPKGELKWFKDWVDKTFGHGHIKIKGYFKTTEELEEHFVKILPEMHARQDRLPAGEELEVPTDDFPAVLTIIDEGLDVAPVFQKGVSATNMGVYMSQGRSTQDHVWMSVQVATVAEIGGIRKAFQMRASLRQTSSEDTKAVLGIDESKGVPCSQIPLNQPGVGFYVTEEGQKMKFRTGYVGKNHIKHLMTTGELPEGMMTRDIARELRNGQRPHYLYRAFALIGEKLVHIYTGETNNRDRRYGEHHKRDVWKGICPICAAQDCHWWAKHVVETHSVAVAGETLARGLESAEIHALQPMFNIAGAGNNKAYLITRRTYWMSGKAPKMTKDGAVVLTPEPAKKRFRRTPKVKIEQVPLEVEAKAPTRKRPVPIKGPKAAPVPEVEPEVVVESTVEPEGFDLRDLELTHINGWGGSE